MVGRQWYAVSSQIVGTSLGKIAPTTDTFSTLNWTIPGEEMVSKLTVKEGDFAAANSTTRWDAATGRLVTRSQDGSTTVTDVQADGSLLSRFGAPGLRMRMTYRLLPDGTVEMVAEKEAGSFV